jgi:hypothetical protein
MLEYFTFYRGNRIDRPISLTLGQLKVKFVEWKNLDPERLLMVKDWPLERTIGVFLMEIGSYDLELLDSIVEFLRD